MPRLPDFPLCADCGKPVDPELAVSDNNDDAPYHPDCLADRLAGLEARAHDAAEDRALRAFEATLDPEATP